MLNALESFVSCPNHKANDSKSIVKDEFEGQDEIKDETKVVKSKKKRSVKDEPGAQAKSHKEEPKTKKPRVKPEKAKEVSEKIVNELCKNYKLGCKDPKMETIALKIGYKNPRSDAMNAALKILQHDGLVKKTKEKIMLTDSGVETLVPKSKVATATSRDETLENYWSLLEENLSSLVSNKCAENGKSVWDKLKDGKAYSKQELLAVTSYSMERSTGFPEIFKAMESNGFAEKVGSDKKKWALTDKVFGAFGRP